MEESRDGSIAPSDDTYDRSMVVGSQTSSWVCSRDGRSPMSPDHSLSKIRSSRLILLHKAQRIGGFTGADSIRRELHELRAVGRPDGWWHGRVSGRLHRSLGRCKEDLHGPHTYDRSMVVGSRTSSWVCSRDGRSPMSPVPFLSKAKMLRRIHDKVKKRQVEKPRGSSSFCTLL
ncbi:hypothetical protein MAR_017675 [Mya arenaria]|uniref:Uncharacterized protein n=1 Tax=Mya arenaria TaxID=6604 RepID=A0ABY7ECH3_MYAAR|nr:hypothetical protein MAR_017675 [Mya arenaria]